VSGLLEVVMGANVRMPRGMKWGTISSRRKCAIDSCYEKGHVQSCELHADRSGGSITVIADNGNTVRI
jgi:hypothetical protein